MKIEMKLFSIIPIAVVALLTLFFPMLCAIAMKLLGNNYSDRFIIGFLAIFCPIPILLDLSNLYLNNFEEFKIIRVLALAGSALVCILFCGALASRGVAIINKRNSNHVGVDNAATRRV